MCDKGTKEYRPTVGPLWERLEAEAPRLFTELGFNTVYSDYSYQHMGDSIAILQNGDLRLRFVRDRSVYECGVGSLSAPDEWWSLGDVIAVAAPNRKSNFRHPSEPSQSLIELREEWRAIRSYFSDQWQQTRAELAARKESQNQRMQEYLSTQNPVRNLPPSPATRFWSTRWHRLLSALKLDSYSRMRRQIIRKYRDS